LQYVIYNVLIVKIITQNLQNHLFGPNWKLQEGRGLRDAAQNYERPNIRIGQFQARTYLRLTGDLQNISLIYALLFLREFSFDINRHTSP